MFKSECDGCRMRDQTILDLRDQLKEANKTSLAVIDAKAYALRYLAENGNHRPPGKPVEIPATSPGELRRRRFQSDLSPEELERTFAAEAAELNATAGATGNPEREP